MTEGDAACGARDADTNKIGIWTPAILPRADQQAANEEDGHEPPFILAPLDSNWSAIGDWIESHSAAVAALAGNAQEGPALTFRQPRCVSLDQT